MMCGITGFIRLNSSTSPDISPERLTFITDILKHRGPDDSGEFFDRQSGFTVGMGHRRLSVLDVAGGRQPQIDNSGETLIVVYNGEIYNYRQLKAELESKGYVFKTTCDTEVIAPLYREYGLDFVQKLLGMYAIAIWDKANRKLILARDPIGKKPLYYALEESRVIFASELKAVAAADETLKSELDPVAVDEYFTLQYLPAPRTIYKRAKKLCAGQVLEISVTEDKLAVNSVYPNTVRDWIASGRKSFAERNESYEQSKQRLNDVLTQAVSDRMISDVPLGAFLSGGIDSTIVVGIMQSLSSRPIQTFSIGFDDPAFDETSYAQEAAQFLKTDHTQLRVTPDSTAMIAELVSYYDEPFADSSALPTWYVCNLSRKSVTVALNGDGGDELFLGYDRYKAVKIASRVDRICPAFMRSILGKSVCAVLPPNLRQGSLLRKARRFAECLQMNPVERYLDWVSFYNAPRRKSLFSADFQKLIEQSAPVPGQPPALTYLKDFFDPSISSQPSRQISLMDLQTYMPECLLVKVDRAAMANSLEGRSPILDRRVIELASSFPQEWGLKNGKTKQMFIDTFSRFLPKDIQTRKKQGFGVPLYKWFKSGPLHDLAADAFSSQQFKNSGIFQPNAGMTLLNEHVSGRFDHSHRLWALLFFAMWAKNRG
ncbi:MAG: asparagine synthase (glutamine-hydrolyzing) [Thermoguttaceae bacterium]|nr:asparagine synthase (glutamine-hydrolyzing) [Thermoguttaceae bacterium]